MVCKRKRQQRKQFNTLFALGSAKSAQMKGRDKTMLQKKTENRPEVKSK